MRPYIPYVVALLGLLTPAADAALIVTYAESPGDTRSTLQNTTVFTFNELATDTTHENVEWTGVGTFDLVHVLAADSYGGAVDPGFENGSPYMVQGVGGNTTTTLTLDSDHAYFGLWWSAGDSQNILQFFSKGELVARFTTQTLLDRLADSTDYRGNPRDRGLNYGENYAFINFFGMDGTTWDKITLSNGSGSGFESDNYTDRAAPWTLIEDGPLPGNRLAVVNGSSVMPVPEPSSGLLVMGSTLAAVCLRRRKQQA
ncbi:PEP-CTERM sorting domain-containing protein [Haloferula sp. BvORR071]|uniref:PEP-CTERM sorting domain-containing protein n=1 Tax=Haloferula sp. BvORR071 TaxID=1396141 RepID=UPI0006979835|nr:PEP-CTERM sorting domain-containing protein [Haloferula sp. BvORR071]